MAFPRVIDTKGLNIPEYQYSSIAENVRHETVIIPSTSQVAFGAYSIFDFKEKACLLNDIVLQFQVSNLNITSSTTDLQYTSPRLTPCWNWFTRIEIVQNNQIIDFLNFLSNDAALTANILNKLNYVIVEKIPGRFLKNSTVSDIQKLLESKNQNFKDKNNEPESF